MLKEENHSHYKTHVFVCTNEKKGKDCCAAVGAEEFRKKLKEWAKENPDWKKRIRINSSGCLDRCKEGIAIAIYPQERWLLNVKPKDFDEVKKIIEEIMNG